jgi:hypothetical protein
MPPYPALLGPAYQSASYVADSERLVNFLLEPNESPAAPSPYVMLPTPGFATFATVSQSPIRGIAAIGSRVFFVAGFALYELGADGTTTLRGTVQADGNPATLCWNGPTGNQMFITSGGIGYGYDLIGNVLTANITTLPATMGEFLTDRFLALDANTSTLQISDLLSLNFNPTQIAVRSAAADPWIAMTVIHNEIWLWGNRTGEVWTDTGTFPYPYNPIPGAFFEQGIAAPFSATRSGSPLLWVGQNEQGARVIWQANGYIPQRVSTNGIEQLLASYSDVSDATSFTYQFGGHLFYIPTFPTGGQTFAFDVPLGQAGWGERAFWNVQTAHYEPLRVSTHCYAFNQHLVGDRATGTIYQMRPDVYSDVGGAAMRRLRQPPRLSFDQKRVTYHRLQLVMDVGVGLLSGQGSDPQVMLRTSGDGGKTYGQERWRSAGKIGTYGARVFWQPCGQQRNRVDQFITTDPVPFRIVDATLDYTVGVS